VNTKNCRYLKSALAAISIFIMAESGIVVADNVWTGSNTTGNTNRTGGVSIGTTNAPGTNSKLQVNGGAAIGYSTSTAAPSNGLAVSGNVGIGVASPTQKLQVNGTTYLNGNVGIGVASPTQKFQVSGTSVFSGNVGVNTANPTNGTLDVEGSNGTYGNAIYGSSIYGNGVFGANSGSGTYGILGSNYPAGVYGSGFIGVYGDGSSYGAYGMSTGTYGIGVMGRSTSYIGVLGETDNASSYSFYAQGAGANYGPFTGAHDVTLKNGFGEVVSGMLVSSTGVVAVNEKSISTTVMEVELSSVKNDPRVLGALVAAQSKLGNQRIQFQQGTKFAIVNALGEGRLWITNYNGNLNTGDLITSSPVAGYGMKQDDDVMHSYTVGKITQQIDWNKVNDVITINGVQYKRVLAAVTYHAG
jgi:hypothetical protein